MTDFIIDVKCEKCNLPLISHQVCGKPEILVTPCVCTKRAAPETIIKKKFTHKDAGVGHWRGLRIANYLTTQEVAELVGCANSSISAFERGAKMTKTLDSKIRAIYKDMADPGSGNG